MRERIVVVGTEGSSIGDAVTRQAAVFARAIGATLHVVQTDDYAVVCETAQRLEADAVVVDRPRATAIGRALSRLRWRLAPHGPRAVRVVQLRPWVVPEVRSGCEFRKTRAAALGAGVRRLAK